MKRYSIILVLILSWATMSAQYADDALRMSQVFYQGTARSAAVGGSMGAIGADFLSASTNPAGMAMIRRGFYTITPELSATRISSMYNGMMNEDSRTVFDLSNIGFVTATEISNNGWRYFQFGFGMNRLNNHNSAMFIQGENLENSKLDVYTELADYVPYDQLESRHPYDLYPAWFIYLIDTVPGYDDFYYSPVPFGGVLQQQSTISKGSTNEWFFSFSGNYEDKLYLGATIGLPYQRYFRESSYAEFDVADTIPGFNSWSVTENLESKGWGINLKVGLIYTPTNWLRIGGAFHTPTYYWSLTDTWYTNTTADLGDYETIKSITGTFDYRLSTPLRAMANAGIIIAKNGFLSFDYEFADYSTARFSAKTASYRETNNDIKSVFTSTHNYRGGLEWRYGNLSFRGGYAFYGSPYANNANDGERQSFSGGIGYSTREFSVDFAYVRYTKDEDYYLYTTENFQTNATENSYRGQQFMLTLRFYYD